MDWYCGDYEGVVPAGTAVCDWLILPSLLHENTTDPTLMATRVAAQMNIQVQADNTSIAAIGIIAWNHVDDIVPVDCPGPLSNCDFDWIWWYAVPATAAVSPGHLWGNGGADTTILSKARRRLGNDSSLLVVVEALGTGSWDFHMHARLLVKE